MIDQNIAKKFRDRQYKKVSENGGPIKSVSLFSTGIGEYLDGSIAKPGHRISVRSAFLRGFTYYRTANVFYGPGETQAEMTRTFESLQSCFNKFGELADTPIEMIQVPYAKDTKYQKKIITFDNILTNWIKQEGI